jgi:hypothetical protein
VTLACPTNGYVGPPSIDGYLVCQKAIHDTTVTLDGVPNGTLNGDVLFDSGTPDNYLYPTSASFPTSVPINTTVSVSLPSGFDYQYVTGSAEPTLTTVNANANNGQTHFGVGYFTTDYFLIDYVSNTEGWM